MMDSPGCICLLAKLQRCRARHASEFVTKIFQTLCRISVFVTRYSLAPAGLMAPAELFEPVRGPEQQDQFHVFKSVAVW
jgi:hypothetical protein